MEGNRVAYADALAVADGYLVPVPFGPFARVTRRVWDAYADRGAGRTLDALQQTWASVIAQPADPKGWRMFQESGRWVLLVPNEVGGLTLMFPDDQ